MKGDEMYRNNDFWCFFQSKSNVYNGLTIRVGENLSQVHKLQQTENFWYKSGTIGVKYVKSNRQKLEN